MIRRWIATATYKTNTGLVSFTHNFDELEELHDLIEAGPDWTTLDKIEVRYDMHVEDGHVMRPALGASDV